MLTILQQFRKELHQYPELSGQETRTANRIKAFIQKHYPTRFLEGLGGTGLAAIYTFSEEGPTILIRCELDALPIEEKNTFAHRSKSKGISHKCGHDGHITIVAGLIFWLREQTFKAGKVILLFQPAEETGKGAHRVLQEEQFQNLRPDYVFALHNIPGEPLHQIISVGKSFSPTVQSLSIHLTGKECHASEPENGINPAIGISTIVQALSKLNNTAVQKEDFAILTPVYLTMGQKSYGISPSQGEVHYTIRTWTEATMQQLKRQLQDTVETVCMHQNLKYSIDWFEYFPATINDMACNRWINQAASKNNFELVKKAYPFKFGEDFGWFSQQYPSAMFGLGAGINTPALHHADYDFPDEIIETGTKMFQSIIEEILS